MFICHMHVHMPHHVHEHMNMMWHMTAHDGARVQLLSCVVSQCSALSHVFQGHLASSRVVPPHYYSAARHVDVQSAADRIGASVA